MSVPNGAPFRRLPSVAQALQYSPFTSSIPFSHDIVPYPSVPTGAAVSLAITSQQKQQYQQTVQRLDPSSTSAAPETAAQLEKVLVDLKQLLDAGNLTQYKFSAQLSPSRTSPTLQNEPGEQGTRKPRSRLDFFAKQVLKRVNIQYECRQALDCRTKDKALKKSITDNESNIVSTFSPQGSNILSNGVHSSGNRKSPHLSPVVKKEQALNLNAQGATSTSYTPPTPAQAPSATPGPTVLIPSASTEYAHIKCDPQADAVMQEDVEQISRKRKRLDEDGEHINDRSKAPTNFERHERQDAAVDAFHEYVNEIFEAQETPSSKYFVSQGDDSVLAGFAISNCESLLANILKTRASRKVHLRYLTGIQRLCAECLNSADGLDFELPTDISDDSLEDWTTKIQILANSIRASKALIRIMLLDREEKQLYSQEVIQNILGNFRRIFESIILPVVERHCLSEFVDGVKLKGELRGELIKLMDQQGKLLKLLGNLIESFDVVESSTSSLEWMSTQLVFADNSGTEKESLLGSQKFEIVRQYAMEVLTKIYLRNPEQRRSMLTEVLSSLEKLPVNRQNARHFKIIDGKPIQLASAMIMQFIQISTIRSSHRSRVMRFAEDEQMDGMNGGNSDEDGSNYENEPGNDREAKIPGGNNDSTSTLSHAGTPPAINRLTKVAAPLYEEAQRNANEVAKHLIERALRSTKSGDAPFRNLLDIFTEDFLSVLGTSDWPAAEWLLQALLSSLITITNDSKRPAPAKTMALDLMGLMGSGISDVQMYLNRATQNIEIGSSVLGKDLRELCDDSMEGKAAPEKVVGKAGPYRVMAEYLQSRDMGNLHLRSARCYFMSQWARQIRSTFEHRTPDLDESELRTFQSVCESVSIWLRNILTEPDQQIHILAFEKVTTMEARLCYALIVLNMPFCRALPRLLNILLTSLSSPHATIRSKSLKSIIQLLEKDPGLLDRGKDVMGHILRCSVDSSPLVRDSALGLIGKVILLRPGHEEKVLKPVISRSGDAAPGVRKRAMRLLKEIYARNKNQSTRAAIAEAILQRVTDVEDSVCEQARITIEDVWFAPFYNLTIVSEIPSQARPELFSHISLIVATLEQGAESLNVLEELFKEAMSNKTKNSAANKGVCEILVASIFDAIIDNDESLGRPSQRHLLQTLTVFAQANPKLFNSDQMTTLRPYIENLSTSDDLLLYRSVIVIYRCVLPVLPPLQHDFLRGVQDILFKSVQRIPKIELHEVATCMWIINGVLQNTERLVNLTVSVLAGIVKAQKAPKLEYERLKRYIMLAGSFGKAFDLSKYTSAFHEKIPGRKFDTVPSLIIDIIAPLSSSEHPASVREMTLDSICCIGQSWPKIFLKIGVTTTFQDAFDEKVRSLELTILEGFREFYRLEERRSKSGAEIQVGDGAAKGEERLVKSLVQADSDGAATSIAQRFLPHIIRNALDSTSDVSLIAAEIITSTNRQGLVHPKECCSALIALETSPVATVSKMAFEEHRNLHHKHESMMEKEYLRAVERSFVYQRDTVKNISGVDNKQSPKLGLFFEAIQGGSAGLRRKLLTNMCSRINFDATNLDKIKDFAYHLQLSRYLLENIGLFEYSRVDEVLQVISSNEKIFTTTGNKISQQIESLLNVKIQPEMIREFPNTAEVMPIDIPKISSDTLRRLTLASMILSMSWEARTYLRRTWGLQSIKPGKGKAAAKDLNRAPVKSAGASAEKYLESLSKICSALNDEDSMKKQCRAFVELLNIDHEMKVEDEDLDEVGEEDASVSFQRMHTPGSEAQSERDSPPPSGTSRKGKVGSTNSTPTKPKKRNHPSQMAKKKSNLGMNASGSYDEIDANGDESVEWDSQ